MNFATHTPLPLGTVGSVWTFFYCYDLWGSATGSWWAEAREIVKHRTVHKAYPAAKNYLAQHTGGAEAEKP